MVTCRSAQHHLTTQGKLDMDPAETLLQPKALGKKLQMDVILQLLKVSTAFHHLLSS